METDAPAILIVDDNEDNRYTLQLLLEADGHTRLATASGGHEALALLAHDKFSLVLLDMMMPDLNGEEVLKIIKGNPDTRDVSVVVLSADTDTERVSKCIEIGADDYLPKPFNPTILRARISSELRKRSLRSMENEYVEKIEQEKKHSEALLRNILPPEIAVRLRKGETNIADHFEDASIIFTDVVGFTKITARMRAFEIVACLNRLFSDFDRLADDVGAEKIKTIGDSYMAAAGFDGRADEGAAAIGRFGLAMLAAIEDERPLGDRKLDVRIGIHCGPATAGVIGDTRFSYDVWGDAVNFAARMESHGLPGRIQVSEAFRDLTKEVFSFDERGVTEIKSIGTTRTFFLVGTRD